MAPSIYTRPWNKGKTLAPAPEVHTAFSLARPARAALLMPSLLTRLFVLSHPGSALS